eukprot:SAG11_NODE_20388_length_446_cov_1.178674_1_plen_24_part_10
MGAGTFTADVAARTLGCETKKQVW